ncbi:NAD(P)-dependent alcohol dehydrogenase [Microbacterium esteraromaticum]|uniref:NAD(P)-dependent alcohol dehydrogenase n=1 Tax=Microbacterium esteraromaticum TaxID=57043 RepID=UPI0019D3B6E0|nr:NAD(P)-dependent alcohol dehydrogenase [Microbacterium esteraromaticum]MBN7794342.1 NAD(P)-dependent alcohol dehydrogenase [Microbacterium esteraromaticum]
MTVSTTTMTAWMQHRYGPASGIRRHERTTPEPRRGEVLLRIEATALNAGDVRIMLGDPLVVRPAFGLRGPRQPVRGMDVAGTVVALGDGVTDATVGDAVVAELPGGGGLAPFATAPVARCVPRPEAVPPQIAATLPIAGGTAWQALDLAGVTEGRRVLILGASGGVGTFAVQLAAIRGAEVHATSGEQHHPLLSGLGAARVLDRDTPVDELPHGEYDAVIQIAGGQSLRALQRLTRPGGTVVLVGGDGGRVLGPIPRMLRAALLSIGSRHRIRPLAAVAKPDILANLLDLVARGRLHPVIADEYAFEAAGEAMARIETGHAAGKLVVHAEDSPTAS